MITHPYPIKIRSSTDELISGFDENSFIGRGHFTTRDSIFKILRNRLVKDFIKER